MSLKDIIKQSKYDSVAKDLKLGVLPNGFCFSNPYNNQPSINYPNNGLGITMSDTNQIIARYEKSLNAWVLGPTISPDNISTIGGRPTISQEQYYAMHKYSEFKRLVNPDYDTLINGHDLLDDSGTEEHFRSVTNRRYQELDDETLKLLSKLDKNPSTKDIEMYIQSYGSNLGYNRNGKVTLSSQDVMHCVFGNTQRIKEFEKAYKSQTKEDEITYKCAIGRYEISPKELEQIREDFNKGYIPDNFKVFRYIDYDDNCYMNSIPNNPLRGADTISYKGIPFAEFNGKAWELIAQSKIDNIPPITSKELWRIFCHVTETAPHLMEQKREYQSLDDLLGSVSSDVVNTSNEEHDRDDEVL